MYRVLLHKETYIRFQAFLLTLLFCLLFVIIVVMEYKSKSERLSTNPSQQTNGKKLPKEKQIKIKEMLLDGCGTNEINRQTGVCKPTIIAVRNELEDSKGFELSTWKKNTANLLSQIVTRGSTRLMSEIENIPAGQLPLAIAIMTDKVMSLQDAPVIVVEHRLRVSHNDINSMLNGDVIDITPKQD